jgi:hypothetical protein
MNTIDHEAAVKAFLEAQGQEYKLSEHPDSVDYGTRKGYTTQLVYETDEDHETLLDTILDEISEEEAHDPTVWERCEKDSAFGYKANYGVAMLSHWRGEIQRDESGKQKGTRFDAIGHRLHDKANHKHRKQFCIEWCFNKDTGKPVKAETARRNLANAPKKQSARIRAALARMDRA